MASNRPLRASNRITPAGSKSPRNPPQLGPHVAGVGRKKKRDPRKLQARRGDCEIRTPASRKTPPRRPVPRPSPTPCRPPSGPLTASCAPRQAPATPECPSRYRPANRVGRSASTSPARPPRRPGLSGRCMPVSSSRAGRAGRPPICLTCRRARINERITDGSHAIRLERSAWRAATRRARFMPVLGNGAASPRQALRPSTRMPLMRDAFERVACAARRAMSDA
ncbi:hypothetical protein SAMN05421548_1479 [Paraburkholderia lycopersici]|uniref:Uncharacterized protein n=1 Tax=Paraburkholderia lycopersici TaxID=416944 RepID=A0A1G7CR24_9BURK|nr:hypothetical protein SAMN05421548_1479 [Paraburkholderia lycopersici]